MKKRATTPLQRMIEAASTLTGKRFNIFAASSVVATSVIIAAAMTSSSGPSPLAGLLGRSLAADHTAVSAPETSPEPAAEAAGGSAQPAPEEAPIEETFTEEAPVSEIAPESESEPEEEPEAPLPEVKTPEAGRIKHVFVISLASPGYEAAFGAAPTMPYLAGTLRPKGDLLSNYSLLDPAALPNSIAAVSGQPPNAQTKADCPTYAEFPPTAKSNSSGVVNGSDCVYPVETLTLADQLGAARFSWHAYMEGMVDETGKPDNCVHPESGAAEVPVLGGYASRLNPFVYFHSLLDLGDCTTNDVPITELDKDLKKVDSTSSFSYISPNLCNAGVSGQCAPGAPEGAAAADAYLSQLVPKILASPAYKKDGLLIITFGQENPVAPVPPATTPTPPTSLKVGTLLISKFVTPNSTDGVAYEPKSLLRSTEELFGLEKLAGAGASKVKTFAPALLGTNGGD